VTSPHRQATLEESAGKRVALVTVDLQNDYCHPEGVFHRAGLRLAGADRARVVDRVNALGRSARAGGHLVVWTRMVWDRDEDVGLLAQRSPFLAREGLRRGTWGAELLDDLHVEPADVVVDKPRFSAFYRTSLADVLDEAGVDTLILTGVRTDFCVESTVRDAFFRDLNAFVAEDAVAGYFPELHDHSLRVMDTVFARVVSSEEAARLLEHQFQTQEV
jgi:ureidoacrylate peracid hydrolase